MNNETSPFQLFYSFNDVFPEQNYLDIEELFQPDSTNNREEQIFQAPPRKISDLFCEGPEIIPFEPIRFQSFAEEPIIECIEDSSVQMITNKLAPSIITKNVCYNICQKTIKLIQKDTYGQKLNQICSKNGLQKEQFLQHIVKVKKNFTGPKALEMYIQKKSALSETFREYMSWFLKEKYLRHCLAGDMNDKQAYIRYKNEVILVILR